MKQTTLLFLYKPEEKKILLAMKKRDFGVGKWNGVGGKLQKGESIKGSLVRETQEEIAVTVKEIDMKDVAVMDFYFKKKPEWDEKVHAFITKKWEGDPVESEEMQPHWFSVDKLPYNQMWVSDIYWLPKVLAGKRVEASFVLSSDGSEIISKELNEV